MALWQEVLSSCGFGALNFGLTLMFIRIPNG